MSLSLPDSAPPAHDVDVLCVGHASYDLIFAVPHHPAPDAKIFADQLIACGGGPAANAAVTVARLGGTAAFAGYLGRDLHGDAHLEELIAANVDTRFVVRGQNPTPLSAVLVKPDGGRALVNYKGATTPLAADSINLANFQPAVLLVDGHEPLLSVRLVNWARQHGIVTVMDAGSLHQGTAALVDKVDYLVCSEKFALQFSGVEHAVDAVETLAGRSPNVIITLGDRGLVWQSGSETGKLAAFSVVAKDTTGAGDAFHGAFALGLAQRRSWPELLRFASAAGALCCTRLGARNGIPVLDEVRRLLEIGKAA